MTTACETLCCKRTKSQDGPTRVMSAPSARQRPARIVRSGVACERRQGGKLDPIGDQINRITAVVRAKVEYPLRDLKRQFAHVKTRYRGLAKNRVQLFTLFELGNLSVVRRRLLALG